LNVRDAVTALAPKIGYDNAPRSPRPEYETATTLKQEAVGGGYVRPRVEFDAIVGRRLIAPKMTPKVVIPASIAAAMRGKGIQVLGQIPPFKRWIPALRGNDKVVDTLNPHPPGQVIVQGHAPEGCPTGQKEYHKSASGRRAASALPTIHAMYALRARQKQRR